MSRRDATRSRVWRYVADNPGTTARDIAREVLGGSGDTRTRERNYAHTYLRELETRGHVEADRRGTTVLWYRKGDMPDDVEPCWRGLVSVKVTPANPAGKLATARLYWTPKEAKEAARRLARSCHVAIVTGTISARRDAP